MAVTLSDPSAAFPGPSRFAACEGIKVHYRSAGTGRTALLFVHGWTCDMASWGAQLPAFAGRIPVLLVDLPGHGLSDKPRVAYTMELFARSLAAVMEDAGFEKAVVVGHSMGTPVARQLYRLAPEKVAALVAVDGTLRALMTDPAEIASYVGLFAGPAFRANLRRAVAGMFTAATPPAVREELERTMLGVPQHVATSAIRGMTDPAIFGDDPIAVPLLLILSRSPFWDAGYRAYVRKLAPGAELRTIDGAGHFLMLERPEEFNALLLDFLSRKGFVRE